MLPTSRKPRRHKKDRRSQRTLDPYAALEQFVPPSPPPPPPAGVTVVAVTLVEGRGDAADFHFSDPVACDGTATGQPWVQMPVWGQEGAVSSEQVDETTVRYFFGDDLLAAGVAWHVDTVPEGLDLGGKTMGVPQAGVIQ